MAARQIPVHRIDPLLVLLLSFFTCGLYLIWWNLKAAGVLNAVVARELISPAVAVISGCCLPVHVYFYYLCSQALPDLGKTVDDENMKNSSTLLIVLGIFLPMVAAMVMQSHINRLYDRPATAA